jgi:photosystem II stability/assembly factor-like uncharacterized protein
VASTEGIAMPPSVGEWVSIGPSRIGAASTGVLFSIAIDPADTAVIYVASPFCGVWKTEDAGASWRVVGDSLPADLPVAALASDTSMPGRVYALLQAGQLYRSDDGAASWTHVNQTGYGLGGVTPAVTDLIVDPSRPQVLHARNNAGCWRSGDGGQTWRPSFYGNDFSTLVLDQARPDVLYAGTADGEVYQTLNGGLDWNYLPLPFLANVYDTKVALTRANPQRVYVRRQKHLEADVYTSFDGGVSWMLTSSPNIYSEYIAADDENEAVVYLAGVDFYRSDDGGMNWVNKPGAHVDHHGFARDPSTASTIYTACDGGIYQSVNRGDAWQFIGDGIANVLFYDLALSAARPEVAVGGTQDNGTAFYDGSSSIWGEILGGDGATVAIDPTDGNIIYAMNQYASTIAQSTDGGASFHNIADGLPTGAVGYNLHFQVHPTTTNILLASFGSLWWTQQPGTPWSQLFTPPDSPNDSVVRSAVDPRYDIYYAATARGRLYAAASGNDFQLVFSHPDGHGFTDLVIDPEDTTLMYASFGGFAHQVYRLRRVAPLPAALGAADVSGGLVSLGMAPLVQALAVDVMEPFAIYAGTFRQGVFRARSQSVDDQPIWTNYNTGMAPAADVRALRVHPATGVMRAATFGRSAYEVNTGDPIGSLIETVGHIFFLRAHELGSGYGRPPDFLDCEVIVLLREEPYRAFGFKLRADYEQHTRREMFDLLSSAFVADSPVRLDYVKTGPRVGEIIRVANS